MNSRSLFIHLVGMTGLFMLSTLSYAAGCTFSPGYSVKNYFAAISASLSVPRDAAIGPIGSEILVSSGGPITKVDCTFSSTGWIYYMAKLLSPGDVTSTYMVYQTNVPGIGFRLRTNLFSETLYSIRNTVTQLGTVGGSSFAGQNTTREVQIKKVYVQFYITGTVKPGNVTFNSPTLAALVGSVSGSETDAVIYSNFTLTGKVPVTVLACETPDITVDMNKHDRSDFRAVGSTSSATSFNFAIKNCSKNLNSVYYTFKPASGISLIGSGNGQYLTLKSSSTARGVGIQMLHDNGTPVTFNTKTKFSGYSASTGGSYTVPMKARYIRTGTISPGTANSAVEFTMSYE